MTGRRKLRNSLADSLNELLSPRAKVNLTLFSFFFLAKPIQFIDCSGDIRENQLNAMHTWVRLTWVSCPGEIKMPSSAGKGLAPWSCTTTLTPAAVDTWSTYSSWSMSNRSCNPESRNRHFRTFIWCSWCWNRTLWQRKAWHLPKRAPSQCDLCTLPWSPALNVKQFPSSLS